MGQFADDLIKIICSARQVSVIIWNNKDNLNWFHFCFYTKMHVNHQSPKQKLGSAQMLRLHPLISEHRRFHFRT